MTYVYQWVYLFWWCRHACRGLHRILHIGCKSTNIHNVQIFTIKKYSVGKRNLVFWDRKLWTRSRFSHHGHKFWKSYCLWCNINNKGKSPVRQLYLILPDLTSIFSNCLSNSVIVFAICSTSIPFIALDMLFTVVPISLLTCCRNTIFMWHILLNQSTACYFHLINCMCGRQ